MASIGDKVFYMYTEMIYNIGRNTWVTCPDPMAYMNWVINDLDIGFLPI